MDQKENSVFQPLSLRDAFDGPVWSHCFQSNLEPPLSKHFSSARTLLLSAALLTLNQRFGNELWGFENCFLVIVRKAFLVPVLGWCQEWVGPQMLLWLTLFRLMSYEEPVDHKTCILQCQTWRAIQCASCTTDLSHPFGSFWMTRKNL